jgi:hypothetical protein
MTKKSDQSVDTSTSPQTSKSQSLKFFVVSYAPNGLREESVNIAVVIVGDDFAEVRIVPNWERVLALDPEADTGLLTAIASEIRDSLRAQDQRGDTLFRVQDSWSNTIRVSCCQACLTDDPASGLDTLASQYLS